MCQQHRSSQLVRKAYWCIFYKRCYLSNSEHYVDKLLQIQVRHNCLLITAAFTVYKKLQRWNNTDITALSNPICFKAAPDQIYRNVSLYFSCQWCHGCFTLNKNKSGENCFGILNDFLKQIKAILYHTFSSSKVWKWGQQNREDAGRFLLRSY